MTTQEAKKNICFADGPRRPNKKEQRRAATHEIRSGAPPQMTIGKQVDPDVHFAIAAAGDRKPLFVEGADNGFFMFGCTGTR